MNAPALPSHGRWVDLSRSAVAPALFFAALAASSARADSGSDAEKLMVGSWYGESAPSSGKLLQRFVTTRHADGTYSLHARLYDKGKVVADMRHGGLWGVSHGLYFTITTEVNGRKSSPRSSDAMNAYSVQALGADSFEYVHVASGNRFRVRRLAPTAARLPD